MEKESKREEMIEKRRERMKKKSCGCSKPAKELTNLYEHFKSAPVYRMQRRDD